ncbi:hypothetical protein [Portibacter marinus]|uniref:hypothetical protein n=1 Tax=Portibacter marinus TaxID=2898660 RepID=UPI001F2952F2|nr:hypothetical protein [Portibacter marinus]
MKTFLFCICALFLLFYACESADSAPSPTQEEMIEDVVSVKDTISIQKFNKWRNAWEKDGEAFMDTSAQFQYFTLPIVDLSEVLAENATGAKYYFGLEKIENGKYYLKFMLVGTDENEDDLMNPNNKNYVYDMSKTCPPFCTQ